MNAQLERARSDLEIAVGVTVPPGVEAVWVSAQDREFGLPWDVSGRFRPAWPRTVWLNEDSPAALKNPGRALVHEVAHLVHWHETQFAGCSAAEVERFAVCATLLVGLRRGRSRETLSVYTPAKTLRVYYLAQEWFWKQGPEAAVQWMRYVLSFGPPGPEWRESPEPFKPAPRRLISSLCIRKGGPKWC